MTLPAKDRSRPPVPEPSAEAGTASRAPAAPSHPLAFALTLTGLAGFLDAAAFVRFNHLYVSFMSGNSTHLGMAVAEGTGPVLASVLGVVGAFVAGATAGTWIADHATPRLVPRVLGLEAGLLAAATGALLGGRPLACAMLVAQAMGLQNVLHQAVGGVDVGKGFVTGMLFRLGQSLARLWSGKATGGQALTSLLNWLAFVGGAALGTRVVQGFGFSGCLLVALAVIGTLMIVLPKSFAAR
ncbi:DUF1275 domain-containing protein [Aquabacter sp. L1I39]|uniref:YoaK family protein n=1 Tax=Aquabacter sp. L1I39 TaxID=2820278 RepID=UPI001ADB71C2|nr:YoaK family protein [Aquabacter sp. L1I39]QTL04374.1 DUF1275 domain-containing protein [Aquabacter sp. L1I39]